MKQAEYLITEIILLCLSRNKFNHVRTNFSAFFNVNEEKDKNKVR